MRQPRVKSDMPIHTGAVRGWLRRGNNDLRLGNSK